MRGRAGCALVASLLIVATCGRAEPRGEPAATGTVTASTVTMAPATTRTDAGTSSAPTSTTIRLNPTSTSPAGDGAMPPILIASPQGVFLVESGVATARLVDGRAATAADDGLGGLLYQIDAGRQWERTEIPRTTIVWWVPQGAERPIDLLVPAANQSLTLEDAVAAEGNLTVLYRRSEGNVPDDIGDGAWIDRLLDSLRRYDHDTAIVTELFRRGAWEQGFDIGSIGGSLIAGTLYGHVASACFFLDLDGEAVSTPADPTVPGCEGVDCPDRCALSSDGERVAFVLDDFDEATNRLVGTSVIVSSMTTGEEIARVEIVGDGSWHIRSLDLSAGWLIVNRKLDGEATKAWIVDLDGSAVPSAVMPVAGRAVFASAPVTVRPSGLQLAGDGLGIVDLGQPMASAMPLLEARFGAPSDEWSHVPSACGEQEHCCFMATGYGCNDFFRSVAWEDTGLSVIFSDRVAVQDGVARLTYWGFHGEPGDGDLATGDGITIGALVSELRAVYGQRLATTTPCGDAPMFRTDDARPLYFTLSGAADDPSTVVTSLWAGNAGSC